MSEISSNAFPDTDLKKLFLIRLKLWFCGAMLLLLFAGCGGSSSPAPQTVTTPVPAPGTTSSISHDHVFLVVLENHSYSSVIGNPAMPYLNRLAQSFGLA